MAYILQIIIDNRRLHYLRAMGQHESGPAEMPADTFVVSLPKRDVPLFYFSKDKAARVADEPGGKDIALSNAQIACSMAGGELQIHIRQQAASAVPNAGKRPGGRQSDDDEYEEYVEYSEQQTPAPAPAAAERQPIGGAAGTGFCLVQRTDRTEVCIGHTGATLPLTLTCAVILEDTGGRQYEARFTLHLIKTEQLVQGALDFGSEASQLMESRYRATGGLGTIEDRPLPLFELMKAQSGIVTANECIQQERGNPQLFRSVFLLRKQLLIGPGEYDEDAIFLPEAPAQDSPNLIMVLDSNGLRERTEAYHQLPNLKLLSKHADSLPDFPVTYKTASGTVIPLDTATVVRQAYATVLRTMVLAWLGPLLAKKDAVRFVRLTMLVPNIYTERDVNHALYVLDQVLSDIRQHHEFGVRLGGWEVLTVSESDAAFLGYYFKYGRGHSHRDTNKYYVIIDCGKGTTDFSIIQQQGETLQPVYRSGIAGAGNLISFAIFQALLQFVDDVNMGKKELVRRFAQRVSTGSDFFKLRLAENIERLKKTYRPAADPHGVSDVWADAQTDGGKTIGDLDDALQNDLLLEILNKVSGVPDEQEYLQTACEFIATLTAKNLASITNYLRERGMTCDGVYFTGRGFLFEPLAASMKAKLVELLNVAPTQIVLPRPEECKSLAVSGVLKRGFIMQPQLIGWPVQTPDRQQAPAPAARPADNRSRFRIRYWIRKIVNNLLEEAVVRVDNITPMEQLNHDVNTHRFVIGNKKWQPEDPVHFWDAAMKYDLLYDPGANNINNTHFCVRKYRLENGLKILDSVQPLVVTSLVHEGAEDMVRPSLFPAIIDSSVATDIIG